MHWLIENNVKCNLCFTSKKFPKIASSSDKSYGGKLVVKLEWKWEVNLNNFVINVQLWITTHNIQASIVLNISVNICGLKISETRLIISNTYPHALHSWHGP